MMKSLFIHSVLVGSVLLLTGCGGGGSEEESSQKGDTTNPVIDNSGSQGTNQNLEKSWLIQGILLDENNQPIKNAKIAVTLDKIEYSTRSDSMGKYSLKTPQDYAYPKYFSGVITAEGYKPSTLLLGFSSNTLTVNNDSNSPKLQTLKETDVIFFNGLTIIHLGDDSFSGSSNSQFQVSAQGLTWKDSFNYSAEQKNKYNQICITMTGKGIEASVTKSFISLTNQSGKILKQNLVDSDSSGSYSSSQNCFALSDFSANDQISLNISSNNGGTGYDDFEVINITGQYQNSSGTGTGS